MESFLTMMWILAAAFQPGGDGYLAPAAEARFPLVAIVYTLVALAAICVLGFRNARRTHLD